MARLIQVSCAGCPNLFMRSAAELNRNAKLGRPNYCSRSCTATTANAPRKAVSITVNCGACGRPFTTTTHAKGAKFCSRSCASKGSMNEDRRAAQRLGGLANTQNLLTPAEALRRREAQKYELLSVDLTERSIRHQFEYPMEDSVFDLALPDHRILVEFDGPYHRDEATTARDHFKDRLAHRHGWAVLRLLTPPGILGPDVLCALLRDLARAGVSQASLPVPSFTAPNEESSQRGEA